MLTTTEGTRAGAKHFTDLAPKVAPGRFILAEPNPSRMAKTTPSRRAKSKTPAPKKKPTQLDRIEKSIGLIESKLTTLNAWETLNEAMSNDKLASPTVAVEEIKPQGLNRGDYTLASHEVAETLTAMGWPWGDKDRTEWEFVEYDHRYKNMLNTLPKGDTEYTPAEFLARAAITAKELGLKEAHEARLKAEAQAAEDAKLVFGARVKWNDNSPHTVLGRSPHDPIYWLLWCPKFPVQVQEVRRHEFTLLP